ncbi:unnamed protein product [Caenorhabditis auriculariae]|uniref:Uncharacterized protein n=1 Tax=Caenorhabditis auriculariae TaxID=2777116 RepID=A0A8S1GM83_9PELO|nr:unnamed protein product [Caenorhabditis auriculariae]
MSFSVILFVLIFLPNISGLDAQANKKSSTVASGSGFKLPDIIFLVTTGLVIICVIFMTPITYIVYKKKLKTTDVTFSLDRLSDEQKQSLKSIKMEILAHSPLEWLDLLKCGEILHFEDLVFHEKESLFNPISEAKKTFSQSKRDRRQKERRLRPLSPPPPDRTQLLETVFNQRMSFPEKIQGLLAKVVGTSLQNVSFYRTSEDGLTMKEFVLLTKVEEEEEGGGGGNAVSNKTESGKTDDNFTFLDGAEDVRREKIEKQSLNDYKMPSGGSSVLVLGTQGFAVDVLQTLTMEFPTEPHHLGKDNERKPEVPNERRVTRSEFEQRDTKLRSQWLYPTYCYRTPTYQNYLLISRPQKNYVESDMDEYSFFWRLMTRSVGPEHSEKPAGLIEDDFPQRRWVYLRKFNSYWDLELENRLDPVPVEAALTDFGLSSFLFSGPWTPNSFIDDPRLLFEVVASVLYGKVASDVTIVGRKSQQFVDAFAIAAVLVLRIELPQSFSNFDLPACFQLSALLAPPQMFYEPRMIFDIFTGILLLCGNEEKDQRYDSWMMFQELLKNKVLTRQKNEENYDGLKDIDSILNEGEISVQLRENLKNWTP